MPAPNWVARWFSCRPGGRATTSRPKGFSSRLKSYYSNHAKLDNPNYYFLDDQGKLIKSGYEIIECCKAHDLTLGMGHVSWQESLAFIAAARDMGYAHRIVVNHVQSHIIAMPLDAMKRAAEMGAFLEACWNALAPGRMDSPDLVKQFRQVGLRQIIASTDYILCHIVRIPLSYLECI